jgi:excinuclease ABC subunit A
MSTGKSYPPLTPHTFSFNTETGMCLDCQGLGFQYGADLSQQREIAKMTPLGLFRLLLKENTTKESVEVFSRLLKKEGIDPRGSISELEPHQIQLLFGGIREDGAVQHEGLLFKWRGFNAVLALLAKSSDPAIREPLLPLLNQSECPSCKGTRLNPLARNVKIDDLSIAELCRLSIDEAAHFIDQIALKEGDRDFLEETLRQLKHRLHFLRAIGLGYLSLERSAPTLSGGESQRIRLARQLGSGLTGCLYVLDEPTIGLHPHDNERLNQALKHLCSLGNTLLLVEHDPLTIALADQIIDFGPAAGKGGGTIMASGTLEEIKANPNSLTGAYLSGAKKIPLPASRKKRDQTLSLLGASLHNLRDFDVHIPIQAITCISGVSGSGKSTLLSDLLQPAAQAALRGKRGRAKGAKEIGYLGATLKGMHHFDKLLVLDQNPIGHTNRADVSTYVDLLSPLRYFFASLPEAKARGLSPKNFSFNHRKGMCTTCWGHGMRQISMQLLPPVKVNCESCQGFRLNPLSLKVLTKGKHLGHLLQMSVDEAIQFLPPIPKAVRILETLQAVGLGYLKLGQEIATLSGGEAQRMRLSRELAKRSTGSTLYLLDEPTVGLHADDIAKLLPIFQELIERGNTVVIIEHNLDVLACADHLIDMGPGSGAQGGKIIASGTPEEVSQAKGSKTAPYLSEHLHFLKVDQKGKLS